MARFAGLFLLAIRLLPSQPKWFLLAKAANQPAGSRGTTDHDGYHPMTTAARAGALCRRFPRWTTGCTPTICRSSSVWRGPAGGWAISVQAAIKLPEGEFHLWLGTKRMVSRRRFEAWLAEKVGDVGV